MSIAVDHGWVIVPLSATAPRALAQGRRPPPGDPARSAAQGQRSLNCRLLNREEPMKVAGDPVCLCQCDGRWWPW